LGGFGFAFQTNFVTECYKQLMFQNEMPSHWPSIKLTLI